MVFRFIVVKSQAAPSGVYNTKKVWSTSFTWTEALQSPNTNKQYSTPV